MLKVFTILIFSPIFLMAQDSPMQAAPGAPPPPQGWSREAPPNGGIHLPDKSPKKKYRLRMGAPVGTPTPKSSPSALSPNGQPSPLPTPIKGN